MTWPCIVLNSALKSIQGDMARFASLAWCIKSYCSLKIFISGHSNCNCFILDSIERGCDLAMHRPELGTQVHSRRYGSLASLAWCIKSYCSLKISISGHSNCNCFILDSIERGCDLAMHRPELGTQVHSRSYGSLASLAWCIKSYCSLNISTLVIQIAIDSFSTQSSVAVTWPCIVLNSALKSIQGDMARLPAWHGASKVIAA